VRQRQRKRELLVLNGDGTDEKLLMQEYIGDVDVFCALTYRSEYAGLLQRAKVKRHYKVNPGFFRCNAH